MNERKRTARQLKRLSAFAIGIELWAAIANAITIEGTTASAIGTTIRCLIFTACIVCLYRNMKLLHSIEHEN